MQISELKEYTPNEATVYCPLLKKEIEDADCYEIVHCGLGDIKKRLHPEIADWDKAISICAKCSRN